MDKIIISDTSCLIALTRINQLPILKSLFDEIFITEEVQDEFGTPLPDWIRTKNLINNAQKLELEKLLDSGEASAIALALEIENSLLIIDELKGRKIASQYNVPIIGTLGILLLAKKENLIVDLNPIIQELSACGFRISKNLVDLINEQK